MTVQRGAARTFGEGLRRSTVAHFARKVRGANIAAAKHELKIQRRYAPERWLYSLRVRGPHFASKVSYNAGAATDDYAGQRKSPQRGRCCQYLIFYFEIPTLQGRWRLFTSLEFAVVIGQSYYFEHFLHLTFTSYHTAACAIASLRASKNCL